MDFIAKNVVYPILAKESGIQGTVYIKFVVEPDGNISNIALLRGIGDGCDEEALSVVRMLPKWIPGK
jgi:protein TonB